MKSLFYKLILVLIVISFVSGKNAEKLNITVIRTSHNAGSITGELYVDGKFICHTLEKPWQNNESFVSSIPQGSYTAHLRFDHADAWRIELDTVPNRTNIQIHIGNFPSEIQGCVLVGETVINKEDRLEGSAKAYERLKKAFYGATVGDFQSIELDIIVQIKYYPLRTTYTNTSGTSIYTYQDKGTWDWASKVEESGQISHTPLTEVKRDLTHIYFTPYNARMPLKDGYRGSYWNDKWTDGTVFFRRKN